MESNMKNAKLTFFLIIFIVVGCVHEIQPVFLKEAPKPDETILSAVSSSLKEYRESLQWKEKCSITTNREAGLIETNWYPVHKGEVKEKIQIYVWGKIYQVDVWHKGNFRSSSAKKDYISRLVEMNLQTSIENKL